MTAWESFRRQIDAVASKCDDPYIAADAIVRSIPPKALPGLMARLTQREIEKARDLYKLTRPRPQSEPKPDMEPVFQDVYEHPEKLYTRNGPSLNAAARRKFQGWCRRQGHDFDEWFARLVSKTTPDAVEVAKVDWLPGYRTPTEEERDRKFWKTTMGYVEQFAQTIRLEVTAELLGSEFTLPDGRKVTWAEATLDDHEVQRNHLGQVLGDTAAKAAMHQRAIDLLCEHDVKTLGELEKDAA